MILYRYIRNLRHTFALSLGFGLVLAGCGLAVKLLIKQYDGLANYQSVFGISSPYYMLIGFVLPLLLFFKRGKTTYYLLSSFGLFIASVLFVMDWFGACKCDYIVEDDISICLWSVGLFFGMLIFKKLE